METIRVALAQINSTVGDIKANGEKIIAYIQKAQKSNVNMVIFPELALTGYPPEDLLFKKHFVNDNIEELRHIIGLINDNITVIMGFVDKDAKDAIYNAAAVIHNNKLKGVYRKINLPNYGVFDEKRYFRPGSKAPIFALDKITYGINICEDIWQKKGIAKRQAKKGAQLIINISASPYYMGKINLRENMLVDRAKETKAYICYNNLIGGQDELVFDGGSLIVDPQGKVLVFGKQFEEDLIIADLPIGVKQKREKRALPEIKPKKLCGIEEVYNALVLGTRDYVKKNEFEKVAIGLSGGIDSSLTAVIACDALGRENVVGVSMPSRYSSGATQGDAKTLAQNLGIKFIMAPIESIFSIYLTLLEKEFSGLAPDVTEENLQARIRGNILMALSNKFRWLVLTTGNKSETCVGYCTLYGDMAGGFAVLKDVPKTLVYKLAQFRNKMKNKKPIPESILAREPSAELRQGQKDSDSLPPYPVLDGILKKYVEEDNSLQEVISSTKLDPNVVKAVIEKIDQNEYKRRQSPPGIKITPKAFGKDRRLPITNRYKEY